jgi:NAD(P)-dependent dehydrogenase (short-subunit alcohol dehydrogenase family)
MALFAPLNPPLPAWSAARVWVIGASTGIGAATARGLLAAGARVALSARSADKLRDVAGADDRAVVVPLDFTDTAAVTAAWDHLHAQWDGVDLVLIVAGTHQEVRACDRNEFAMPNLICAEEAASAILAGLRAGEFEIHFPKALTRKMKFLRLLPYRLYFALVRKATGL